MFKNFKELYSYYTGKSFNTYISNDNILRIQKPVFNKEFEWEMLPNTNDAFILNQFYNIFERNPIGDVSKMKDSIDIFYDKFKEK